MVFACVVARFCALDRLRYSSRMYFGALTVVVLGDGDTTAPVSCTPVVPSAPLLRRLCNFLASQSLLVTSTASYSPLEETGLLRPSLLRGTWIEGATYIHSNKTSDATTASCILHAIARTCSRAANTFAK